MTPAGLLLLDKPEGPTSHDVIDSVRLALGLRRVGHTGTLDPFASGLLLVCIGWATRLAEYLTTLPKTYIGLIRLGERTDTDDRTGTVLARNEAWRGLGREELERALASQVGVIHQRPPDYSAKRVGGRRSYAVAREGGRPELETRRVMIRRLQLLEMAPPDVRVEIECSSGTYVRAVARDVGEEIGSGAHLRELRRTRIGDFHVREAVPIEADTSGNELRAALRAPAAAASHLPHLTLDDAAAEAVRHGRPIDAPGRGAGAGPLALFHDAALLAIAELRDGRLCPVKVFPVAS
jgi:tRNA pseudouridine55 synthase